MITYPNCKINLGLHVVRKRADGYHDLETIFLPVDALRDELEINIIPEQPDCPERPDIPGRLDIPDIPGRLLGKKSVEMTVEGVTLDCGAEENLCVKAYRLLEADLGERMQSVSIRLRKGIPFGAGLGGGSSDASYTLKMLNDLFDLRLDNEQLKRYASRIGADCAFFIENKPCYATGIGDQLEPLAIDLSAMGAHIEIEKPDDSVSTREAYSGVLPHPHEVDLRDAVKRPLQEWKELIVNDFEKSVFPNHPQIAALKERFYARGAQYAAMTGSGAAVFGIWWNEK